MKIRERDKRARSWTIEELGPMALAYKEGDIDGDS